MHLFIFFACPICAALVYLPDSLYGMMVVSRTDFCYRYLLDTLLCTYPSVYYRFIFCICNLMLNGIQSMIDACQTMSDIVSWCLQVEGTTFDSTKGKRLRLACNRGIS